MVLLKECIRALRNHLCSLVYCLKFVVECVYKLCEQRGWEQRTRAGNKDSMTLRWDVYISFLQIGRTFF